MNRLLNFISRPSIAIVLRKIIELNFRKEKELIKKHFAVGKDDRVLDLGCGTGEFSPFFPEENYIGIDIDKANIDYAKAHYPRKFLVADARKLPFEKNSFSKILIVGVLHHLEDNDCLKVLREAKRVIRPGGKILVMEDAKSDSWLVGVMQSFDRGNCIRSTKEWEIIFKKCLKTNRMQEFRNGLAFYSAFMLRA